MKVLSEIEINLDAVQEGLKLWINSKRDNTLFDEFETYIDNNEARYQLVEGCFYNYELSDSNFILGNIGQNIIQQHSRNSHLGTIAPNIFVGTLEIPLLRKDSDETFSPIQLEVQSIKSGYRDDYRDMLELITEKCTELLLQSNSPVSHYFDVDYAKDSKSNYQKFAFIKSVIGSEEFKDAVHRIVSSPVTRWIEISEKKDIRGVRRFSNSNIKELVKGGKRTTLPQNHFLKNYGISTLPERISSIRKTDSVDTSENRFIKHALETFLKFCTDIHKVSTEGTKLEKESLLLIKELESQLHHAVFKDISRPTTLKLNSPVLQRKEGYREVLRTWLQFELAAKLIWKGGEDVYGAGKKDIATLYEYWLFFKLLDLFQEIFEIDPKDISELVEKSDNNLNLRIKQGNYTALSGIYQTKSRKLNVRFNYNRSFKRNDYPNSGSWTTNLRPDYTLSFWPFGISDLEAEHQELIVHIHFDAKYKIANLSEIINEHDDEDLNEEKIEQRKGVYKNADLLKMHAYKDAIRRTGGAYVLYPGSDELKRKGFHEIIPGLGAFPVRPSKTDSGIGHLKSFILEIINHFVNRTSQREKIAYRAFDIYKNPPSSSDEVREILPENFGENRDLMADETFVLVGFYNSNEQHEWIKKSKLYNFRMGSGKGSLILDKETVSPKYLLLHTKGDKSSNDLWKIVSRGPKVFSKYNMKKIGYPKDIDEMQENYLIIELEEVSEKEFKNITWNFRELKNYSSKRSSAYPFTASVSELMKNKIS